MVRRATYPTVKRTCRQNVIRMSGLIYFSFFLFYLVLNEWLIAVFCLTLVTSHLPSIPQEPAWWTVVAELPCVSVAWSHDQAYISLEPLHYCFTIIHHFYPNI